MPQSSAPATPQDGDMWYDEADGSFKFQENGNIQILEDYDNLTKELSGKDSNGIFTTVTWKDAAAVVRRVSELSGTSPEYNTRTVTWYASDGVTVIRQEVFSLSYDIDGDFIGEELL